MKKYMKSLIIFTFSVCPVLFTCLILLLMGKVTVEYKGFAVDSRGGLYVGREHKIAVINEGEISGELRTPVTAGYIFTINGDTILLAGSGDVLAMDLDGNILSKEPDERNETYDQIQENSKRFTASDGTEYVLRSISGYYWISRISDDPIAVVYTMPILDYVVKNLLFGAGISFIVFIPIILFKAFGDLMKIPGGLRASLKI